MNKDATERIRKRRYELLKEEVDKDLFNNYHDKKGKSNKILSFFSSIFLLTSIALGVLIYAKNDENGKWIKDNFGIELSFSKVNQVMSKYTDYILDFDIFKFLNNKDLPVSYEPTYAYLGNNIYESQNNMISSIGNGTVVFVGEDENQNVVIVQHDLGYTATYFGLDEVMVKKFDRVNNNDNLGMSYDSIKILFEKDSEEITYEEVINLLS
jgi:hypothetical protein